MYVFLILWGDWKNKKQEEDKSHETSYIIENKAILSQDKTQKLYKKISSHGVLMEQGNLEGVLVEPGARFDFI